VSEVSAPRLTRNQFFRLVAAVGCAILAAVIAQRSLHTIKGQNFDGLTRFAVSRGKPYLFGADTAALDTISMGALIALTGVVFLIAAARKRRELGIRVLVLVAGANLTTQILKHWIIHRPALGVDYQGLANSLPSGHTTVAMTAAIGIVMVVVPKWRSVAVFIGWLTGSFVGIAVMLNQWHRLSDVLTAILIAAAWGLVLTPREATNRRFGHTHRVTLLVSLAAALLGALGIAAVWLRMTDVPLSEAALQATARTSLGLATAGASVLTILGLSGLVLAMVNTQARH
jgi:hypothetical protein